MRKLLATTAIVAVAAAALAAATGSDPTPITKAVEGSDITVSDLLNREVHVMTGSDSHVSWTDWTEVPDNFELSGEIEDLLLGKDGQITTVVLGKGGLLDLGQTEAQVDIARFGVVRDADDNGEFYVVYTGAPSDLQRAAPYRGLDRISTTAKTSGTGMVSDGSTEGIDENSVLEWVPVYSENGDWIGEIDDLTQDDNGKISVAIVDTGGFLGIGETPVAVPYDKITLKRDPDSATMRAYVQMRETAIETLKTESSGS